MKKRESGFKHSIWRPIYRTLRVDILTLFLSLFIISFTFVIFFTHIKQKKAIEEFSLGTVERASDIILERVKSVTLDANRFPIILDSIIWEEKDISENNQNLMLFLLRAVQLEDNFAHIFTAALNGNCLAANDLTVSAQDTYITRPSQALPADARFSILWVDSTVEPNKNIWYYYDKDLNPICYEESIGDEYDPRHRPWYKGALETKGVYWSDVFTYFPTGDKGISVSEPLFDKEGTIIGVSGVELSFVFLSRFLSMQRVGNTGQAFLLHSDGNELVMQRTPQDVHKAIPHDALMEAYRQYSTNHQITFQFGSGGIQYLAYVNTVPIITGKHWLIMIIVPNSDFFSSITHMEEMVSSITFGVLILAAILVFYFSKRLSTPIVTLSKEVDKMKHLDLTSEMRVKSNIKEIILMDTSIAALRNGLRSFARYVPSRIVKQLIEKGEEISLGGEKKEITVFFTDIAGFSSFSEANSTDIVMAFLSEYFDALSKIIIKEEGIIDKYIGDSIMAFWGAPLEIPDHAIKACTAALQCQAFLERFNRLRKDKGEPELSTRIAINTGTVIIGNIGTLERMNYTVIGDAVNAAAHLQLTNKIYHSKTIVTEETLKETENRFLVRPLDIVAPTGKKTKIKIYELIAQQLGESNIAAAPEQRELCDLFTRAFDAYHTGKIEEAKGLFSTIQQKFPDDFPTQIYLDKIRGQKGKHTETT
jgi:adenylate cyclase